MENQHQSSQVISERLEWFQQAKFGLFLHWGAYSAAGEEASWPIMAPELSEVVFKSKIQITQDEYEKLPARFNPIEFDADEWVRMAKDAGMRYIIITAKHHDGFCMFDAPGTDYKITNTPYGKDICLEMSQACAKAGMRLGFYYSPPDMHHPGYRDTSKPAIKNWLGEPDRKEWAEYLNYMESHIRKLLTDYGHVSVLWFDGLFNHGKYDPERFHKLVHELSPETLINDRLGTGYDYVTPEQFIPTAGIPARTGKPPGGMDPGGDGFVKMIMFFMKVPIIRGWLTEQLNKYAGGTMDLASVHVEAYPPPERFQPWESCMTMGQTWAYKPSEKEWKSPRQLVQNLVEVVSGGGNFLLNVGPMGTGKFPDEAIERLKAIGEWTSRNQEAIYGSTYTPIPAADWGRTTRNGEKVFLHIFEWPADAKITIEQFPGKVKAVRLIDGQSLAFSQDGQALEIGLPDQSPDQLVPVIEVLLEEEGAGWKQYSEPVVSRITPQKYIKDQAVGSFVINAVANGLIAFLSYFSRSAITYGEAAVDILITVGIISYLTSWVGIAFARSETSKGNLFKSKVRFPKLPAGAGMRALIIMLFCIIVFGGGLDGLIYLISPDGFSNWGYIAAKTLYTGVTGALAAWLAILSVLGDQNRS